MTRKIIRTASINSHDRVDLNDNFSELYTNTTNLETNKVPYTGATGTLNLGSQKLVTSEIESSQDLTIDCGVEKTLVLDEVVWDDLRILPSSFDFPGVADPSIVNYQPTGSGATFSLYEFQEGDYALFSCQVPHGYKEGADIAIHVHWTPGPRGNEESGKVVAWRLEYSWADVGGTFPASSSTGTGLYGTVTGTDHYHEITADVSITGTGKHISSMLLCKISRASVAEDTWVGTSSGQRPMLLEVDFHIPLDTIGSRTNFIK